VAIYLKTRSSSDTSLNQREFSHCAIVPTYAIGLLAPRLDTWMSAQKKLRLAKARRSQFRVPRYLLANVGLRFHTDSDRPPEAGVGLLTLS
jgi:ribosomal protein L39E